MKTETNNQRSSERRAEFAPAMPSRDGGRRIANTILARAAMMLIVMMLTTLTAQATDFITDVMVIGNNDKTQFDKMQSDYEAKGWTAINKDLNAGCGSGSDYIHLLYKTQNSPGSSGKAITDFYIKTGKSAPANLTHDGRTYYLVSCDGSTNFKDSNGDLNRGCGSNSAYIHLYYTTDPFPDLRIVTDITFNATKSGAVGADGDTTGYDLNEGCGSGTPYIYMHVTIDPLLVTLTSESGDVQLHDGNILTGTGGANTQVTIADGATVTLKGVNITAITHDSSHQWAGITCMGDAVIILDEGTTNNVKGGIWSSGIFVPQGKTLTIQGSGTLNATGGYGAAGIGGGYEGSCGNISISGSIVNAYGGDCAAGIGSGYDDSSCGDITISGGTVTATGGESAAGIGSGYLSSCGNITISGGTVTATGGERGAGIGGGYFSSCGDITITNEVTRVTATKGEYSNNAIGVGMGSTSTCGTVTIGGVVTGFITQSPFTYDPTVNFVYTVGFNANGGTGTMADMKFLYGMAQNLTANSFTNSDRTFLGWATSANGPKVYNDGQSVSNLTETAGATVTLYAKWTSTVVTLTPETRDELLHDGDIVTGTGGANTHVKIVDGATVTLKGVNITAISDDYSHQWAGITCMGDAVITLDEGTTNNVKGGGWSSGIFVPKGKTLTIQGSGMLNATGGYGAAGIGGSYATSCGNIIISGGTVNAYGSTNGAGIGSGDEGSCGNITISGGTVTATGGERAAGIGSGYYSASCDNITISGGIVNAYGGLSAAGIGSGYDSSCGNITISSGTLNATGGYSAAGIGGGYDSSCGDITISGGTVTANGGKFAAGIGGGYSSSCGDISITNDVTMVTATKGDHCNNTIGAGTDGTCGTVTIGDELTDETEGNTRTLYHGASAINPAVLSSMQTPGNGWFTLDGRQLSDKPTQRGIYINNGKKVVIK